MRDIKSTAQWWGLEEHYKEEPKKWPHVLKDTFRHKDLFKSTTVTYAGPLNSSTVIVLDSLQ